MTGANGGADPGGQAGRRWDVALSFAGAQRDYVGQVAQALKTRGIRCFYDADEQVRLWGTSLAEELPRIFARESAAVVVFVSADYAGRDWTRLERRAAFSRAVVEAGVYVLPARFDDSELPALLPDVVDVNLRQYTPGQFADLVVAKLADLGISASPSPDTTYRASMGRVRVSEADPRRLGVHAAISVPGVLDEIPPEYVPRDMDAAEHGVRAKVATASQRGGFVLLLGGSSVGKTRSAVQAVKALLPGWWLVHPAGPSEVAALAAAPPSRTVVWLDELQRYLDGEHALTGGVVRALLNAPHVVVIIGTLWPDLYIAYTTVPAHGGADLHAREREVLDLAEVVRVDPAFSPTEQGRARTAAARDPRLQVALGAAGYGLTQTLAAAPQLVARWDDAQAASPYAWAVLTAALDAARLGARAPLSTDLLRTAAVDYCTSQQQAEAPENWFEQALAYATGKLYGAAAALNPVGSGMGRIVGYVAADYLIQHAGWERRYARVPASTWDAVVSQISDPADAIRLADSASSRLLYRYAIPLYRHAADSGDWYAAWRLVDLLAKRGDLYGAVQILRYRADAGDRYAARWIVDLLVERGDLEGAVQILRERADAGDEAAHRRLAGLLAERGDLERLRERAVVGDEYASRRLTDLLAERGDLGGLRERADAGDGYAAWRLAELLAERGDLDGAAQVLRARADAGDWNAAWRLTELLAERGDLDGAAQILRPRADAGDWNAAERLAGLLAERRDLEGLRERADAGDWSSSRRLAGLLAERGDLEGLRERADAGDRYAADRLAERGDLKGLRERADAGDWSSSRRLAGLLAERGDLEGLRERADAGDRSSAMELVRLLAERGDLEGLRERADAGDGSASRRLTDLLAERRDLEGLRERADAGDGSASRWLAGLLAKRGDLDGAAQILRVRADAGDESAATDLVGLLAERGDLEGLRERADAGDGSASRRLAGLLAKRGDLDGAAQILRVRADAGDGSATRRLADLLAERGDLEGLRERADAGDQLQRPALVDLLAERDDLEGLRERADAGDQLAGQAGRPAGRARRSGGAARAGRRWRRTCCRVAGRAAGRARRSGGAARAGQRRRRRCRRAAG